MEDRMKDRAKGQAADSQAQEDGKSMEELFDDLDGIMERLESSDTTLEESFSCYEQGMRLVKACGEKIDKVEKQMVILQGGGQADGDA